MDFNAAGRHDQLVDERMGSHGDDGSQPDLKKNLGAMGLSGHLVTHRLDAPPEVRHQNPGLRLRIQQDGNFGDGGHDAFQIHGDDRIDRNPKASSRSTTAWDAVLDGDAKIRFQGDDAFEVQVDVGTDLWKGSDRRGVITVTGDADQPRAAIEGENDFRYAGGQGHHSLGMGRSRDRASKLVDHRGMDNPKWNNNNDTGKTYRANTTTRIKKQVRSDVDLGMSLFIRRNSAPLKILGNGTFAQAGFLTSQLLRPPSRPNTHRNSGLSMREKILW